MRLRDFGRATVLSRPIEVKSNEKLETVIAHILDSICCDTVVSVVGGKRKEGMLSQFCNNRELAC